MTRYSNPALNISLLFFLCPLRKKAHFYGLEHKTDEEITKRRRQKHKLWVCGVDKLQWWCVLCEKGMQEHAFISIIIANYVLFKQNSKLFIIIYIHGAFVIWLCNLYDFEWLISEW